MTDRPILFSGPMIRALLDGRKTQTRRVLKPAPYLVGDVWWIEDVHSGSCHLDDLVNDRAGCMKYQAGDRLWVRETWAPLDACKHNDPGTTALANRGFYRADYADGLPNDISRWRPSIHMPRWASRLTLIVTDVRVQRLQEISEDDALAEGIGSITVTTPKLGQNVSARDGYEELWNSLNDKRGYGWDASPWVCALTFTVHQRNIDA